MDEELENLFESTAELFNKTTIQTKQLQAEIERLQSALERIAYFVKYDETRTSEWIINFINSTLDTEEKS